MGFIYLYALSGMGDFSRFGSIDNFISLLMRPLYLIGLGIKKPFILGVKENEFYENLTGIGMYGVVMYNAMSILLLKFRDDESLLDDENSMAEVVNRFSFSLIINVFLFSIAVLLLGFFSILNAINGWVVFNTSDSLLTSAFWVCCFFLLPGSFVAAYCYGVIRIIKIIYFKFKLNKNKE